MDTAGNAAIHHNMHKPGQRYPVDVTQETLQDQGIAQLPTAQHPWHRQLNACPVVVPFAPERVALQVNN